MQDAQTDILMITHNRPEYTALSLPALLKSCDALTRVWIWHNGTDDATRAVVSSFSGHERVWRIHFSDTNEKLRTPTNWFWQQSDGKYVGKVDDDCLVPQRWIEAVREAHDAVPELGVIGCSRLRDEDIVDHLVRRKLTTFDSGHTVMRNAWVAGSGYLMKRDCIARHGLLRDDESFTGYCVRLARAGWINGFYYPFLFEDHMDDPRSSHTQYRTDADFQRLRPLTADAYDAGTLRDWSDSIKRNARLIQEAPIDARQFYGWRRQLQRVRNRWRRALSGLKRGA
jgi:GT2 family glycosyltransferase